MKWIGITGSWRATNKAVEDDVRAAVKSIITNGDGIVTGGALNVDYFATDEALSLNPNAKQIRVIIPSKLDIYAQHYRTRAQKESLLLTKQNVSYINLRN